MIKEKKRKREKDEDVELDRVMKEARRMAAEYVKANKHIDPWLATYSF